MIKINQLSVQDIRFPTSNDLTGSDAIHTDPDYSATYVTISTSDRNLVIVTSIIRLSSPSNPLSNILR